MKLKLLMLSLLMLPAAWTVAQKIDDHEVEFDYTRLPKKPVDKGNKNYCSEVILAYEAPIVASQTAAEAEYEQAVKDYPQVCKDAEARHKLLMDRYDVDMGGLEGKIGRQQDRGEGAAQRKQQTRAAASLLSAGQAQLARRRAREDFQQGNAQLHLPQIGWRQPCA